MPWNLGAHCFCNAPLLGGYVIAQFEKEVAHGIAASADEAAGHSRSAHAKRAIDNACASIAA